MARLFDDASSQYLSNANAVVTAVPCSMAAWVYKDDTTNTGAVISIGASATVAHMTLRYNSSEDASAISRSVLAGANAAVSSGAGANNVWTHVAAVFASSTSRAAYRDGGNKGTNATDTTPLLLDRTHIGQEALSGGGNFFSGRIAEAAIWNIALSDADVADLAKGYCPLLVRPDGLVAYWPLIGRASPEPDLIGAFDMTLNAGPTQVEHPRIIYPSQKEIYKIVAAAVNVPNLMYYYRMRRTA